jgi:hypothetical protein
LVYKSTPYFQLLLLLLSPPCSNNNLIQLTIHTNDPRLTGRGGGGGGGGRRLNGLLYIYVHAGDVLNEYSINDKKLKMNIHKVNMKYICIFKNSTVHLYNNERCLKKIKS